jgi:hypothetical protein
MPNEGSNQCCAPCLAVSAVALVAYQVIDTWTTEAGARALAAPPRAVTIQIDPPPSGGSQWDLCFWISTGEEGESFEEQCFDSDARRDAGQYWKVELELGHHVLRFEGQTAAAGWSWTLHDGKVHAPLPADAESFYEIEEDETSGVLAHYAISATEPQAASALDVEFVLGAADGFELLTPTGGPALEGPAASMRGGDPSAGAFCADLGRVYADDPMYWATACYEDPSAVDYWLPITDAQCASIAADGCQQNDTVPCAIGDLNNLTATCAPSCCSICDGNCMLHYAFLPDWSFAQLAAAVVLIAIGCSRRCPKPCFSSGLGFLLCQDIEGDWGAGIFGLGTVLTVYCFLHAMNVALEDPSSPFWGSGEVGVSSFVPPLVVAVCGCGVVFSTAQLQLRCARGPKPGQALGQAKGALGQAWHGPKPGQALGAPPAVLTAAVPVTPPLPGFFTPSRYTLAKMNGAELRSELAKQTHAHNQLTTQVRYKQLTSELRDCVLAIQSIEERLRVLEEMGALQPAAVQEGVPPGTPARHPTFAESGYRKAYQVAPRADATTLQMLFNDVQILIDNYCRRNNCAARHAELLAQDLTTRLLAQTQTAAAQDAANTGIAKAAMLVWTSHLDLRGTGRPLQLDGQLLTAPTPLQKSTLFQILNDTIRQEGRAGGSSIAAAARIARCINELCVSPRPPPGLHIPSDNLRRVFRGGGFDPKYRGFYESLASASTAAFRIPQYWATSLSQDVAIRFMHNNSGGAQHNGLHSLLWDISMPADEDMWNAALVQSSHFAGEQEYLFVPFSTFVVLQVSWGDGTHARPHRIELMARCDNRNESADLPTAPWA